MDNTPLADNQLRGLARAIARGQSLASWANVHDAQIKVAEESCTLAEFKGFVEAHRLRVTDQVVGKLLATSQDSVDGIRAVSQRSPDDTARLSASRTLLDQWLKIAGRFHTATEIAAMKAELTLLNQKKTNARIRN